MTLFELLPWVIAVCVMVITRALLAQCGLTDPRLSFIALGAGIAAFAAYWILLKLVAAGARNRRSRKERGRE